MQLLPLNRAICAAIICLPLGASIIAPRPLWSAPSPISAPPFKPVKLWAPVQDKNFYLLSLIEKTPRVAEILAADPTLKKLTQDYAARLKAGYNEGKPVPETATTFLWSQTNIDAVAEVLQQLYRDEAAVRQMVEGPLRQSGMYERLRGELGERLLSKAWREAAGGLNHVVNVYGLGGAPHYPKIDAAFYDVKSTQYAEIVNLICGSLAEDESAQQLFFQPSLRAGLALMDANRRDEAGRFEPMEQGENAVAFKRIGKVEWSKTPYSLILVLGHGPEEAEVALAPKAKLLLSSVARRFKEGKAPFILVSGGYVHPNQTPFCEAIEMKKSLVKDFGVPESAILIDPHARHTTTNFRNAARLMFRYGIPTEKMSLVMSVPSHIKSVSGAGFEKRCEKELGYQPAKYGKLLSPQELEFQPLRDSLHIDPTDPLDP